MILMKQSMIAKFDLHSALSIYLSIALLISFKNLLFDLHSN